MPDECPNVGVEGGPASARPGLPSPGEGERPAVPADDGIGCDEVDGPTPVGPEPGEQHPNEAIGPAEPQAVRRLALADGDLVPEGKDLRLQVKTRLDEGLEGGQ